MINHKTQISDFINGIRRNVPVDEQYHHGRPELAIINKETFDEARRIREERYRIQLGSEGDMRRRYTSRYLFSRLVRCSVCGCTMCRQNVPREEYGRIDGYWRCKSRTRYKNSVQCNNSCYVPDTLLRQALANVPSECIQDKRAVTQEIHERRRN